MLLKTSIFVYNPLKQLKELSVHWQTYSFSIHSMWVKQAYLILRLKPAWTDNTWNWFRFFTELLETKTGHPSVCVAYLQVVRGSALVSSCLHNSFMLYNKSSSFTLAGILANFHSINYVVLWLQFSLVSKTKKKVKPALTDETKIAKLIPVPNAT